MSITIRSEISVNDLYTRLLNTFPGDVFANVTALAPYKIIVYLNRGDDYLTLKSLCIIIVKN